MENELIVTDIINKIYEIMNKGQVKIDNLGIPDFEYRDETLGTCYVNVYYKRSENKIKIDKYYESESLQDSLGKSLEVDINKDNPDVTVATIIKILENIV